MGKISWSGCSCSIGCGYRGITLGVAAADDEYPPLEATTLAGALFGKVFVLTDRILGVLVESGYDTDNGVYTIGSLTEEGTEFAGGFAAMLAYTAKILADIMRMLAGSYASALVGKLILIINGVPDNFVRWESAGNATAPVYIIIGLTDDGKDLAETLGDLIVNYARKAVSDSEEASVNSTAF